MIEVPENILNEIEQTLKTVNGCYGKWLAFTLKQMHAEFSENLLRRIEPGDIIGCIIEKLINGTRKWDREKYPSFFNFFYLLIRSEVRNLAKKQDNLLIDNFVQEEDLEDIQVILFDDELASKFDNNGPEKFSYPAEETDKFELVDLCFDILKDEEEKTVFLEIMEGKKNRQIAAEKGIDISKVEAVIKRIRRRTIPIINEYLKKKKKRLPVKLIKRQSFQSDIRSNIE